ncbi:DNA polymerase III subunit gamma and tau [Rathayibacter sp. YIM 133350]|uniref:DNA polymerase III subunit gamma and tau n=1 Tax=Rathayibacter sp. YIM 133350 TaxID=3131992 RepID=UPI00307FA638
MVTALYRRYRPETFSEMIGQSQVTDPLMTALRADRVNHAYLFSGPRGCGKTTSARILARCLNCAEGPTDTPCGKCDSCVELSRAGGGSLDVVEIDAASHNGVDDARDLRERAIFAPARDRYKIFILDEAHMVTPQGFNALLKLVEEPPEHVKFIFATTEPEKVLGTIRSRTHHYPFRLVPPAQMLEYVQQLCDTEGVTVAPGVLPLVVRAGGGSPRDTLSLLDQLMAGSEDATVDYERAVALLGYTHGALLDEVIDAIAARDAAGAFAGVDRVIQTGQDPRRFVEDLLERLRDLIIVAATSLKGASAVLRGVPQDDLERMAQQAARFGQAELSRTADIVNTALTEMTGATSPRLHLELLVARALVPSSDETERGALARVERLERRIGVSDAPASGSEPAAGSLRQAQGTSSQGTASQATAGVVAEPSGNPGRQPSAGTVSSMAGPGEAAGSLRQAQGTGAQKAASGAQGTGSQEPASGAQGTAAAESVAPPPAPVGPVTLQQVKDAWPEVLEVVKAERMNAWMVVFTAQVRELRDDDLLVLAFPSQKDVADLKQAAAPGQGVGDILKRAVNSVLGFTPKLIARVEGPQRSDEPGAPTDAGTPSSGAASGPAAAAKTSAATAPAAKGSAAQGSAAKGSAAKGSAAPAPTGAAAAAPAPAGSAARSRTALAESKAPAASRAAASGAAAASDEVYDGWATITIPGSGGAPDAGAASVATSTIAPPTAAAQQSAPPAAPIAPTASAPSAPAASAPSAPAPSVPTDDDVPFDDDEPPFDPYYESGIPEDPQAAARSAAPAPTQQPASASAAPSATAQTSAPARRQPNARRGTQPAASGPQRYGESVVREVLGATFLEEQPHTPNVGFRG